MSLPAIYQPEEVAERLGMTHDGANHGSDEALILAGAPFAVIAAVRLPHPAGTKATVVWDTAADRKPEQSQNRMKRERL